MAYRYYFEPHKPRHFEVALTVRKSVSPADVHDVQVGVMGLGVAGAAMARLLAARGAKLTLADRNVAVRARLEPQLPPSQWRLGDVGADAFAGCAMVAASPGVSPSHPAIAAALAAGKPVFGEVELIGVGLGAPRTLAITGTNGKSTTTSLAGALVHGLGHQVFVGGNLGDPIGDWLLANNGPQAAVLELSSYQIDGRVHYTPDVAVVLNVTPDHLARYGTLQAYAASKARLVAALLPSGTAVLNADDEHTRAMRHLCRGQVLWLSTQASLPEELMTERGPDGAAAQPSGLVVRDGAAVPLGAVCGSLEPMPLEHPLLLGRHNQENTLAALLAVAAWMPFLGHHGRLGPQALRGAYHAYRGLPHRLACVGIVGGVRYLNDSKATNDASAATAVQAMETPFVLLVGGQDKGGGYQALVRALQHKPAKAIIAFGEARSILSGALVGAGVLVHQAPNMAQACALGRTLCAPGDTLLLSPACTSFDAFDNYQHRGDTFVDWVHAQA